jgi:hypothetical protein
MADPQPTPLEIVETIVPKQNQFVPFSDDENTQSLADNLPDGILYRAKNIPNTNFRKFLSALSLEIGRIESFLEFLADDYYIWTSTISGLLPSWERTVGIPDSCFKVEDTTPVEIRIRNVIAKLALMNVVTRDDFVLLAEFFGFRIEISGGVGTNGNVFPLTFPVVLFDSFKEARFTMIVKFLDKVSPNIFPFTFPITFGDDETSFLRCVFRKLKPAYCGIIFLYLGEEDVFFWIDENDNYFITDNNEFFVSEDSI